MGTVLHFRTIRPRTEQGCEGRGQDSQAKSSFCVLGSVTASFVNMVRGSSLWRKQMYVYLPRCSVRRVEAGQGPAAASGCLSHTTCHLCGVI
jgi:hypothetical protein